MQFEQVFWNPNFGDYSGFDTVCEYARSGRHACSSVGDFLKSRAQIEETYAKQLLALAKSQAGVKLDGSIGRSWDAILANAQRVSASHQKLADVFGQQSQLTNQLAKTLKQKARQKEEEVRNCQNECRTFYEKALKNKTEFIKRADQRRSLEEEKERLKKETSSGGNSQSVKDVQKLDSSIKKAIASADLSKQQCGILLEQLDGAKDQWEGKTEQALMTYHEMERNRIVYLRSLFWAIMNAICQTCVETDKECDTVRNLILKCDPVGDLEEFIALRKTGEKRPEPITFENIGNTTVSITAPSQRTFKMAFGKRLANPWKSSNGQSITATQMVLAKTPQIQKASLTQRYVPGKESPTGIDDVMFSSDGCSSSSISPSSPTSNGDKKNGSGLSEFHPMPPSAAQLNQHRASVKHREKQGKSSGHCLVTRTWTDNQGTILVQAGSKAKLLEKCNNDLWHIQLEDGQSMYCPVDYLQEVADKQ